MRHIIVNLVSNILLLQVTICVNDTMYLILPIVLRTGSDGIMDYDEIEGSCNSGSY